jgi:hypothetical protein
MNSRNLANEFPKKFGRNEQGTGHHKGYQCRVGGPLDAEIRDELLQFTHVLADFGLELLVTGEALFAASLEDRRALIELVDSFS